MLALSPMLVGGVKASFAYKEYSTLVTLLIEIEEARVSSARSCICDEGLIVLISAENIKIDGHVT